MGGDIKISKNLGIVVLMAIALTQVAPMGKKRPTQLRNEQRMIEATVELLVTHPVDEVTSRAIAEASSSNVSYIIRYWGSRDAMLAAVADALCSNIVTLIERRVAQVDEDQVLSFFAAVSQETEVAIWIKLNRHLAAHHTADDEHYGGASKVLLAVESLLATVLDVSREEARPMAVMAMTLLLGGEILGPVLGTTQEEFAEVIELATEAVVHRSEVIHDDEDEREEAS